jgi:disulfide bond formation protein DsbB
MLIFYIHTINLLYAIAGLVVLVLTVGLLVDYIYNQQQWYRQWVAPYVWLIIMATSLGGLASTLLYSEVFGFVPCSLCWLQRVALYPQALMSIMAFKVKDAVFFPLYGLAISAFGLVVAIYQYIYQAVPQELLQSGALPCLADGSADCSKKIMEVFGFVTFPFLSAVTFLFLIVLYVHLRRAHAVSEGTGVRS